MTRRKPGRPSQGLSETRMEIRLPKSTSDAVRKAAKADGVTVNHWWRTAALAELLRAKVFAQVRRKT